MNGDAQCYPGYDRCPSGYHGHEDEETGMFISNSVPSQQGL